MAAHHDLPAAINSNQNTTQDNAVDPSNITTQNGIYVEHNQRLQSFGTWPKNHNINPWKLAEAGFYYQGHKDHVICFSCNVKLCDWEDEEDPWVEHIKFRPECKHVCQKNEENFISAVLVLIKTNSKVTLKMVRDQMDKSHHQSKSPHYHTVGIRCQVPNCSIRADKPKHPQFKDCFTRLATFREWPLDHPISPFFIAEAGYFLSKERHLCCFFCGDKILIFSENDDVYEEHARRAPQCAHILQVKGKEFIHLIQMKDKDADSTESHCSEVEQSVKVEELPGPPSGSSLPEQVKISSTRDEWTELEEGDQNVRVHSSHNAQPLAATATDSRPVQEPSQSATDTRLVQESSHSAMDTRLVQESSQSATDTRLLQEPSESTEAFVYSESASLHTLPPTDLVMSLLAEQQSQNNRGEDYRLANLVCRSLGITRRICATQDNTFDPTIIDVNPQEPSLQNTGGSK